MPLLRECCHLLLIRKTPTRSDSAQIAWSPASAPSPRVLVPACARRRPHREVAAQEAHGGDGRIRAARFPADKSLEECDFDYASGLKPEC